MAPDFGGKPWSWFHHLAVETALASTPGSTVRIWVGHEPSGDWWNATKQLVELVRIEPPQEIYRRPLCHPAHIADVVRLQALRDHGGTYIDSDVWSLRSFDELDHGGRGFWMGRQGRRYGLCNATMGGQAGSAFARRWLEAYRQFRSKGHDAYWDEHSVRLPLQLASMNPSKIQVFPPTHFFDPLWTDIRNVFRSSSSRPRLESAWSVHLWESKTWDWLSQLSPKTLDRRSEIFRRLASLGVLS